MAISSPSSLSVKKLEHNFQQWFMLKHLISYDYPGCLNDLINHAVFVWKALEMRAVLSTWLQLGLLLSFVFGLAQLILMTKFKQLYVSWRTWICCLRRVSAAFIISAVLVHIITPSPDDNLSIARVALGGSAAFLNFMYVFWFRVAFNYCFFANLAGLWMILSTAPTVCATGLSMLGPQGKEIVLGAGLAMQRLSELSADLRYGFTGLGKPAMPGDAFPVGTPESDVQVQAVCSALVNTLQVTLGLLIPFPLVFTIQARSRAKWLAQQPPTIRDDPCHQARFHSPLADMPILLAVIFGCQLVVFAAMMAWSVAALVYGVRV